MTEQQPDPQSASEDVSN